MRAEEMRIRETHGGVGARSIPSLVTARLAHGLEVRRQLLRFALAMRPGKGRGWSGPDAPPCVWWRFALALLPLSGRLPLNEFVKVGSRPW